MRKSETIAERLIRLRVERNFTQARMGQLLGVTKNYIYLIESEKNKPGKKFIAKLDSLSNGQSQNLDQRFALADTNKTAVEPAGPCVEKTIADQWVTTPDEQFEKILLKCVELKDWGGVEKMAAELHRRKLAEINRKLIEAN
jgi:transcriptional regulator with XRE-family HTH domain